MLLIIFFLIFLNISFNYKYRIYENYLGYIKKIDDSFKVVIYVLEEEVSNVVNYSMIIEGSKYNFEIENISEEIYLVDNLKYKEMILDVNLNKKYELENNVINITLEKGHETLWNKLKKGIKKWIN